jgi:hypothetical protein
MLVLFGGLSKDYGMCFKERQTRLALRIIGDESKCDQMEIV